MKVSDYLKNLNVLYVEDEENIREPFSFLLKKYFKNVYIAKNGQEGLELYKKYNPDIVITDIRMPVMDGIEMSKKIKELNPDSLIIVITAFSDTDYLTKAIDIGIDAYLTKPLELDKLFKKLNFFASIIKNKKEKEEFFHLLKEIFDNQTEAILLLKENSVVLQNNTFENLFNPNSNEILNKIDFSKQTQEISINDKIYKVNITKLNNYILISFIDVTDYENAIFKDSLTKLYNRKILPKIIKENLNKKICLIMLDIDNFKKINDTYGHLTGDEVLKKISEILRNTLRKEDTITRWGGEEFLVLLQGTENIEITKAIANKIRSNIENENFKDVNKVTASFGVCCDILKGIDYFDKILNKTDEALYKAKANGKNQVQICNEEEN